MKQEEIKDLLKKNKIKFNSHSTIYATIKPNVGAIKNGIGNLLYANKTHIIHFNSQGVIILPLNEMSGKVEENLITIIPENEILSKELKVKFLSFQLNIKTKKGDISYGIRRSVLGAPWHKENLSFLLLNTSNKYI